MGVAATARLTLLPIHTVPSLTSPFPTHHTTTPCQAVTTSDITMGVVSRVEPVRAQCGRTCWPFRSTPLPLPLNTFHRPLSQRTCWPFRSTLPSTPATAVAPPSSWPPAAPAAPAAAPAAAAPPAPAAPDAGRGRSRRGDGRGSGRGGRRMGEWPGKQGGRDGERGVGGRGGATIVPVPIIRRFLADASLGHRRFPSFASLGVSCQPLENCQGCCVMPFLALLLLPPHLLFPPPFPPSPSLFLLSLPPLSTQLHLMFRKRERLPFDYLVSLKPVGETARVSVLAARAAHGLPHPPQPALVPAQQFDISPSYFIFAGLVFVPLTQPYLHEYGPDWFNSSPRRLCERALRDIPSKPSQQIVILSRVLADEVNSGFERLAELQVRGKGVQGVGERKWQAVHVHVKVKRVNGKEVENLRQLRDEVLQCTDGFVRFDLDDDRVIAVSVAAAKKASAQILRRYRVPCASSWDLQQGDAEKGEATVQAGAS
ncbi:unnamed protein product [Closterium sp. NIES-64]|nr:unnamed protein product [Closterium sp. NIES-64]